jgi:hypothetical protein
LPHKKPKKDLQKRHTAGDTTPSSETRLPKPPPDPEVVEARKQYFKLQLLAMARAAKPLDVKFSFRTTDSVLAFLETTSELAFKKEIDGRLLGALNGAAGVAVRILQPPPNIQQTVQVAGPQITINFDKLVERLTPDEQTVLSRAIARLEAQTQSG